MSRAHRQRQESGRPNWPNRPFGLNRDGTLIDAEAEAIRDAYRRIIRGASLGEIVRRWNAAGILTSKGEAWHGDTPSRTLKHPRTAALMDATGTPGNWAAILTRTEWDALRATIEGRSAKWERAGRMAKLLSGIAECYACGTPAV